MAVVLFVLLTPLTLSGQGCFLQCSFLLKCVFRCAVAWLIYMCVFVGLISLCCAIWLLVFSPLLVASLLPSSSLLYSGLLPLSLSLSLSLLCHLVDCPQRCCHLVQIATRLRWVTFHCDSLLLTHTLRYSTCHILLSREIVVKAMSQSRMWVIPVWYVLMTPAYRMRTVSHWVQNDSVQQQRWTAVAQPCTMEGQVIPTKHYSSELTN